MGQYWFDVALIAVLMLVNGAFAGSEIALISLREGQLRALERRATRRDRTLVRLARDPNRFLGTIQLGITLAGYLASATAAVTLAQPLMSSLSFLGDAANVVAIALITFILTAVNLVVGELAPKRLGMQYARQWSGLVASPLNILATVSSPLTWLLGKATDVGWWWCRRAGVRAQRIPPGDLGQSRCSPGSGLLCIRVTDISVSRFGAVALAAALPFPPTPATLDRS
jgi:putative hemolysin